MRGTIVVSLLLVLCAPAAAESIKLGTKAPAVGDRWSEEKDVSIKLTVTFAGKAPAALDVSEVVKQKVEVLAVDDGVITKARFSYETHAVSEKFGGKEMRAPSKLGGRSYTLSAGDPINVEPASEADEVRKQEENFGKPDKLRFAIAGKEFPRGKAVELKPAANPFGPKTLHLSRLTLEYTGMAEKHARFTVSVTMAGDKGSATSEGLAIDLKGTIVVDVASAEVLELDLSGPVKQDNTRLKAGGVSRMIARRSRSK